MYYQLYELNHAILSPARALNDAVRLYYKNPLNPLTYTQFGRQIAAATDVFERITRRYAKPEFGLTHTDVNGMRCSVTEEIVWERAFCKLIHFRRELPEGTPQQPHVVIVAPMSGHYATLLRGTVEALLPHFDVYITDWADARMVPLSAGTFDFADYVDYVSEITQHFGGDVHLVAVCQPTVPVFVAVSLMEQDGSPSPKSVTMMGGPLDTRESPTEVNTYAANHDLDWFRRNVVMTVPLPHPGFMRPVYPGFLQLTGFMTMNLDRHLAAHYDYFDHLVEGDGDSADKHRDFYDEYLSVMDLTAEFYLETVDYVFLRQLLPRGEMEHRGRKVEPNVIARTPLFTVEGEKDDISGIGQTRAAHRMTPNLPAERHQHHEQPSVGHYGVFNGSRFRKDIAPRIVEFVYRWNGPDAGAFPAYNAGITPDLVEAMIQEAKVDVRQPARRKVKLPAHAPVAAQAAARSFGVGSDHMEVNSDLTHLPATMDKATRMLHRPFEQSAGVAADTADAMSAAVEATISSTTAAFEAAVDATERASNVSQGMAETLAGSIMQATEALARSAHDLTRLTPSDIANVTEFADIVAATAEEAAEALEESAETLAETAAAVTEAPAEAVAAPASDTIAAPAGETVVDAAEVVAETEEKAADAAADVTEATAETAKAAADTAATPAEDLVDAAPETAEAVAAPGTGEATAPGSAESKAKPAEPVAETPDVPAEAAKPVEAAPEAAPTPKPAAPKGPRAKAAPAAAAVSKSVPAPTPAKSAPAKPANQKAAAKPAADSTAVTAAPATAPAAPEAAKAEPAPDATTPAASQPQAAEPAPTPAPEAEAATPVPAVAKAPPAKAKPVKAAAPKLAQPKPAQAKPGQSKPAQAKPVPAKAPAASAAPAKAPAPKATPAAPAAATPAPAKAGVAKPAQPKAAPAKRNAKPAAVKRAPAKGTDTAGPKTPPRKDK